jgi:hypothetical protein
VVPCRCDYENSDIIEKMELNYCQTLLTRLLIKRVFFLEYFAYWDSACRTGVATAPLLRELGIAPIEAVAAAARSRAFHKAPTLNTCITDLVRQPSRLRPNTWTYGTVRWLDRFARASAELAQNVRVPPAWRSLQPGVPSNLVKATIWARLETSSSACTNTWSIYSHASCVGNPLP